MNTSARWINDYLDPPAAAEEQADLLTRAGFPIEGREEVVLPSGTDMRQDFEMTSNRGDCLCHVGLAREIAAKSGRTLVAPPAEAPRAAERASKAISVVNREPERCPLYTARIIRGAKVGPSPAWLAERLRARGDIPRNNVVDATNFVLFEMGQPTHVFDLAKLRGGAIIVRLAEEGERFLPIGEGASEVRLSGDDLVIADAERAVAIAGVKGGALTAVTESTTDLLIEAASFDPVSVRNTSRRLGIASDSSYRFERGVHPAQIDGAASRLAGIILEIAGGTLCEGVVSDGKPIEPPRRVAMRPERCRRILGVAVTDEEMIDGLRRLGFAPQPNGQCAGVECTVPAQRLDIEREIDLIEEVGRLFGHDRIPMTETIPIRPAAPQATEKARRAVADTLVGLGFVETVTHTLVAEAAAQPFFRDRAAAMRVDDDRAKAEPVLRPSIVPSLLRVRRHNADGGVSGLRLFEEAAVFQAADRDHAERRTLALLMDVERLEDGLRPVRGVVERLAALLAGDGAGVTVAPAADVPWLRAGAAVRAGIASRAIGCFGLLDEGVAAAFGLDLPLLAAELELGAFYESFPPETEARALPTFPAIARDLSIVVDDGIAWSRLEETVASLGLDHLEACDFVGVWRGKSVASGRKSVTLRLRFRAEDRTLVHQEVDAQMSRVVAALGAALGAEVRG